MSKVIYKNWQNTLQFSQLKGFFIAENFAFHFFQFFRFLLELGLGDLDWIDSLIFKLFACPSLEAFYTL